MLCWMSMVGHEATSSWFVWSEKSITGPWNFWNKNFYEESPGLCQLHLPTEELDIRGFLPPEDSERSKGSMLKRFWEDRKIFYQWETGMEVYLEWEWKWGCPEYLLCPSFSWGVASDGIGLFSSLLQPEMVHRPPMIETPLLCEFLGKVVLLLPSSIRRRSNGETEEKGEYCGISAD